MRYLLLQLCLCFGLTVFGQSRNETAISNILGTQASAWNRGDIEGFMKGYWENDSLMFIGKSGITYGWQQTLDNYKKNYPDTAAMGKLAFDIIYLKKLSGDYAYVVGKWMLNRSIGNLSGHFDILLRKIKGRWLIVADHSS